MNEKITKEISEIAGFFAADGSMQKNHISFWGNPKADRDYYDIHLKKLFFKAFNITINPHDKKSNFVYGFYICDKKIINFFSKNFGFTFGSKTYSVEVPSIIFNSTENEILSSFICGFCAGDGCLNFDKTYASCSELNRFIHTRPRVQIRSVSKKVILQLSAMLHYLGIKNFIVESTAKRPNESDSYMLQVSGKKMLYKWVDIIGFSNPNHLSRYKIFKEFGFVPPFTSYQERLRILDGSLDPMEFL